VEARIIDWPISFSPNEVRYAEPDGAGGDVPLRRAVLPEVLSDPAQLRAREGRRVWVEPDWSVPKEPGLYRINRKEARGRTVRLFLVPVQYKEALEIPFGQSLYVSSLAAGCGGPMFLEISPNCGASLGLFVPADSSMTALRARVPADCDCRADSLLIEKGEAIKVTLANSKTYLLDGVVRVERLRRD